MKIQSADLIVVAFIMALMAAPAAMASDGNNVVPDDRGVHMGPARAPDVVIEEPRPPGVAIETEGRGEPRDCHPDTVTEGNDGSRETRTRQQCDH
jgi:hypothetical protein